MESEPFKKRIHGLAALIVAGVVLIGFSGFLVVVNYQFQTRLEETAVSRFLQSLDNESISLRFFFSDRKTDMKDLVDARELNIYFENKALGMSESYGLRASLIQIGKRFDRLMSHRKIGDIPVYTRIVFVGADGSILVDSELNPSGHRATKFEQQFFNLESMEEAFSILKNGDGSELIISKSYFHKDIYQGKILSWINAEEVFRHLIATREDLDGRSVFIDCPIENVLVSCPGYGHLPIMDIRSVPERQPYRFFIKTGNRRREFLCSRVSITGTPFNLVHVVPASDIFGGTPPIALLIIMAGLSVFVMGTLAFLWSSNAKALVLTTRLNEESIRKKELESHRLNLEHLVSERTKELAQAQQELIRKAVDAGRAQLSAMILHNIGNAITPVSVLVEECRHNDDERTFHYLKACYRELSCHTCDFEDYTKQIDRGIQVFEYMGKLIEEFEIRHSQLRNHLDEIGSGVVYVAEILSLHQNYASESVEMKEAVNINGLLKDTLNMQSSSFKKRDVLVETDLASEIPRVLIDKSRLMQVLVNLIKNSLDAMDENSGCARKIFRTRTRFDNGYVRLSMSDTGIGIEPELLRAIFNFGISSKGSSGFGLYYCRTIVEANQGTLILESNGKGQGATVHMELPAA